jgi:hypothetical protein
MPVRLCARFSSLVLVKFSPLDATFIHGGALSTHTTTPYSTGSHRGLRILPANTLLVWNRPHDLPCRLVLALAVNAEVILTHLER